jgi:hypothetical protein
VIKVKLSVEIASTNKTVTVRHQWLTSVIQLLRRQKSGGLWFNAIPGKIVRETLSRKTHYKKGPVEYLTV